MFVSSAKLDEPIEMPFGVVTSVGPRNRVSEGVQIPEAILGEVAAHCKL